MIHGSSGERIQATLEMHSEYLLASTGHFKSYQNNYSLIHQRLQKGTVCWWNLVPHEVIQFSNAVRLKINQLANHTALGYLSHAYNQHLKAVY